MAVCQARGTGWRLTLLVVAALCAAHTLRAAACAVRGGQGWRRLGRCLFTASTPAPCCCVPLLQRATLFSTDRLLFRACRPFRQWYEAHYGVAVGKKKKKGEEETEETKKSNSVTKKIATRQDGRVLDPNVNSQFDTGRLYACLSSRPGQCGRADGFILEGKELEFYVKRMARKKK
jgi:hypothetical protein